MSKNLAVRIYTLEHVKAIAAKAKESCSLITLYSPKAAALWMGAAYFHEMTTQGLASLSIRERDRITIYLDCVDAAGYGMQALDIGLKGLIYRGPSETFNKLKTVASSYEADVIPHEKDHNIIDMTREAA